MDGFKDLFQKLTDVKELVRWAGYPGLALIVFSETGLLVGFFLPGDSLLVTTGLFAAAGYFNGQKGGHALYAREESRFFKKQHLLKTKEFYEHYGPITIVMAQFMPFARTFAPVVAGIAEMKYTRFASFNVIGAIGWISSMLLIGYFLGSAIPDIGKNINYVIVVVVFLS